MSLSAACGTERPIAPPAAWSSNRIPGAFNEILEPLVHFLTELDVRIQFDVNLACGDMIGK
jgi:hypothetical protein